MDKTEKRQHQLRNAVRKNKQKLKASGHRLDTFISSDARQALENGAKKYRLSQRDFLESLLLGSIAPNLEDSRALSTLVGIDFSKLGRTEIANLIVKQATEIRKLAHWNGKLRDINDALMKRDD